MTGTNEIPASGAPRSVGARDVILATLSVGGLSLALGVFIALFAGNPGDAVERAANSAAAWGAVVLFVWSFFLFLTVLPFGTATIVIAGALLGAWAGWVQFAALVFASLILFEVSGGGRQTAAMQWIEGRPRLIRILRGVASRGLLATAVLRLAPVVPSAVCSLAAAGFGISRSKFFIGTVALGWVRPVAFATLGAAGGELALER